MAAVIILNFWSSIVEKFSALTDFPNISVLAGMTSWSGWWIFSYNIAKLLFSNCHTIKIINTDSAIWNNFPDNKYTNK